MRRVEGEYVGIVLNCGIRRDGTMGGLGTVEQDSCRLLGDDGVKSVGGG